MKVQRYTGKPILGPRSGPINWLVWALFGNEQDGIYGDSNWNPEGKTDAWTAVKWWFRNPLHNLTWHVIGFVQESTTRYDMRDIDGPGWNLAYSVRDAYPKRKYRFARYIGDGWEFYAGWRARGNFGLKLRRT